MKIGLTVASIMIVLPIVAGVALVVGMSQLSSWPTVPREIALANHGTLIIEGKARSRSEHGFSQRAGYRPVGSTEIEWFGDVSDGVEPQVYYAGPLLVVIDPPAAQLFVRTNLASAKTGQSRNGGGGRAVVRSTAEQNWKSFALIFPDDLGPFPISFYAEKNGLTVDEVSRINELGGKRERKYPTTYIQSFDPKTRDLECSYHVDNTSSWPLVLRLSDDGTHIALITIGEVTP